MRFCHDFEIFPITILHITFFETSVLKEVRILRYFYNNSQVLIPKFQNEAIIRYPYT